MKVRKRITIGFTGIFSGIIIPLCFVIYYTVQTSREGAFFDRLTERVEITEQFFLESDRLSSNLKEEMRDNFLKTLPNEVEYVEQVSVFERNMPDSVRSLLPPAFEVNSLKNSDKLAWSVDDLQGVAKSYFVGQKEYAVLVIAEDVDGHEYLQQLRLILLIGVLLTITIAFILSNYFARVILKPIASKIQKANRISANNLDLRLTVYNKKDELGMLAISFNKLLDRLQSAFELEKNFVKFVSHEIKNPLAVIIGQAELALSQERSENEYIETIERIKLKAFALNDFISHFLQLAKLDGSAIQKTDLRIDELIMEIISNAYEVGDENYNIRLNVDEDIHPDLLTLEADPLFLKNALTNLIANAQKFSDEHGQIDVNVYNHYGKLAVDIKDNGIGIKKEELEYIFNPLYRGSNTDKIEGTGLGLALTKKIMEVHEYTIQIHSVENAGTTVELRF